MIKKLSIITRRQVIIKLFQEQPINRKHFYKSSYRESFLYHFWVNINIHLLYMNALSSRLKKKFLNILSVMFLFIANELIKLKCSISFVNCSVCNFKRVHFLFHLLHIIVVHVCILHRRG